MTFRNWLAIAAMASLLLLGGCGDGNGDGTAGETPASGTPAATAAAEETPTAGSDADGALETFAIYAGGWVGQWNNTTFGSAGDIIATGSLDPDGTGGGLLDVGGLVFGAVDPGTKTLASVYDDETLTIGFSDAEVFGDVVITITADGHVTAEATAIPDERIESLSAEGTITADRIDVTYTVTFADGTTAEGTATMTR